MDREISQRVAMLLKRRGVTIETKARVRAIAGEPGDMAVTYVDGRDKTLEAHGEAVLMATGRRAATGELFAPDAEPVLERGAVTTNAAGLTSIPHLYAIGDVRAHTVQLAHVAAAQARNVVAVICGEEPPVDETVVPSCVYTSPEVASVGRSADEAKAAGIAVRCAKQVVGANAKCLVEGSETGYVKLVCDETTGRVLGAQLVCPRATYLVAELALAIHLGATTQDVAATIHPHPTVSEMIVDAARAYHMG
jgi:dihydrolipoamide dehydrogenase